MLFRRRDEVGWVDLAAWRVERRGDGLVEWWVRIVWTACRVCDFLVADICVGCFVGLEVVECFLDDGYGCNNEFSIIGEVLGRRFL